jgi:hypothetical protein
MMDELKQTKLKGGNEKIREGEREAGMIMV